MEEQSLIRLLFVDRWVWRSAGLMLMGLLFGFLGFVYEDPRYEESGVVKNLRANTWVMMNSGGRSGYIEIQASDSGTQRRWTLPLRTALKYQDRLIAAQGKNVKVLVAGEQAKEILQLTREDEVVIPLEESLKYKAQGRAWFGWGGLGALVAGALLLLWRWLVVRKTVLSIKAESI